MTKLPSAGERLSKIIHKQKTTLRSRTVAQGHYSVLLVSSKASEFRGLSIISLFPVNNSFIGMEFIEPQVRCSVKLFPTFN